MTGIANNSEMFDKKIYKGGSIRLNNPNGNKRQIERATSLPPAPVFNKWLSDKNKNATLNKRKYENENSLDNQFRRQIYEGVFKNDSRHVTIHRRHSVTSTLPRGQAQVKSKKTEIQFGVNPFKSTTIFEIKPSNPKEKVKTSRNHKPNISKNLSTESVSMANQCNLKTPKTFNDKLLHLLSVNHKSDIKTERDSLISKPPKYPNNKLQKTISDISKFQNESSLLALSYSFGENLYIPSYFKSKKKDDLAEVKIEDKTSNEIGNISTSLNKENIKETKEIINKFPFHKTVNENKFQPAEYIDIMESDNGDTNFGSILKRPGKKRTSIKHVEFLDNLSVRQFQSDYDNSGRQY